MGIKKPKYATIILTCLLSIFVAKAVVFLFLNIEKTEQIVIEESEGADFVEKVSEEDGAVTNTFNSFSNTFLSYLKLESKQFFNRNIYFTFGDIIQIYAPPPDVKSY